MASALGSTKYEALAASEEDIGHGPTNHERHAHRPSPARTWTLVLAAATAAFVLGAAAGRQWAAWSAPTETYQLGLLDPPGHLRQVWEHNLTFSDKPTPETEAAWNSIVPIGRGFVKQPDLAPTVSNVAVFHQMHCLHAIRLAYYVDEHRIAELEGAEPYDPFMEHVAQTVDRKHMRHCFDYLRRALMCAADTNLEGLSESGRVTTGWGDERVCRDYAGVLAWAEKWRDSDDEGISELDLKDNIAKQKAAEEAAKKAKEMEKGGSRL